jgi:hypothetical protein
MLPNWLRSLGRFVNRDDPSKRRTASRRRCRPHLEVLEDRITPSTLIPVTDHSDLVFDAGRNVLYITTTSGKIQRWDVASQQLLPAWNVGTLLLGADILPDGSSLYVAENSHTATQGFVHQVNLSNGSVTDVPYSLAGMEAGSYDIAIAPWQTRPPATQGRRLVASLHGVACIAPRCTAMRAGWTGCNAAMCNDPRSFPGVRTQQALEVSSCPPRRHRSDETKPHRQTRTARRWLTTVANNRPFRK